MDLHIKLIKVEQTEHKYTPSHHCHEMVMDKKGRLFMTTTQKKIMFWFTNKDGEVLDGWSVGFNGVYGLTLSNEGGNEFLYITDPDLHRVCKTDLNGKLILEIFYLVKLVIMLLRMISSQLRLQLHPMVIFMLQMVMVKIL